MNIDYIPFLKTGTHLSKMLIGPIVFTLKEWSNAHFLSMEPLTKLITNRKVTITGQKVEWLNMEWIRVEKDSAYFFKYCCTYNDLEEWKEVDLQPKHVERPKVLISVPVSDGANFISSTSYKH